MPSIDYLVCLASLFAPVFGDAMGGPSNKREPGRAYCACHGTRSEDSHGRLHNGQVHQILLQLYITDSNINLADMNRDLGTEGAFDADIALRKCLSGKKAIIPGPRYYCATRALISSGSYGTCGLHF